MLHIPSEGEMRDIQGCLVHFRNLTSAGEHLRHPGWQKTRGRPFQSLQEDRRHVCIGGVGVRDKHQQRLAKRSP